MSVHIVKRLLNLYCLLVLSWNDIVVLILPELRIMTVQNSCVCVVRPNKNVRPGRQDVPNGGGTSGGFPPSVSDIVYTLFYND